MANKKNEKVTEGEIVDDKKAKVVKIDKPSDGRVLLGIIFILLGGLIFLNNFYPALEVSKFFWPLILVIFGAALILRSF